MASGEGQMFKEIWEALEPEERVSFVSGRPLGNCHEMRTFFFAHVLGKGRCPEFRLYKKNIALLTFEEHKLWDLGRWRIKENPHLLEMWDKMFKLEEELIAEYYDQHISKAD